jgi:cystathionine gamma-synthase
VPHNTEPGPSEPALSVQTLAVVAGRPQPVPDAALNHPVTFAATYRAGGEVEYGRYGNPTWSAFEEAIGALEGGWALAFASGLAAVSSVLALLDENAQLVAADNAYTGTLALIAERVRQGRAVVNSVQVNDLDAVRAATAAAQLVWLESPTNPLLDVADIGSIAAATRDSGALLVVDNTFATPVLQRPLELGADLVVHSATKLIAGHSDVVLGVVLGRDPLLRRQLDEHRRLHGAVPGPMETWLALRGLRTLAVRVEQAQRSAAALVARLGTHPAVRKVRYPGFGTMVAVELADAAAADALAAAVRLWVHATSLGGVESTLERRRRWASESTVVSPALVRLSVGIEHVEDLWADLDQALATVADR